MKVSKINQLKEKYNIAIVEYKEKILPYQLALDNINKQYKCIKNTLDILDKQDDKKRVWLYDNVCNNANLDKISYFNQKKSKIYRTGRYYFYENYQKLKNQYTDILAYLSLKQILLNYQIDCITINTVSELCYYIDGLYGSFDIMQLQYKRYDFIYKLLTSRNLYIKDDSFNAVYSTIDNYYIYNSIYGNSTNQPYKAFYDLFNIKVPKTMQVLNNFDTSDTDTKIIPFKLRTCNVDKIYILLDKFLQYIKQYTIKLRELESIKEDATQGLKLIEYNTIDSNLDGYTIKDICTDYGYNVDVIKELSLKFNRNVSKCN